MYLIDTSIWIDYLRERENSAMRFFDELVENKLPFGITSVIYQEILQGAASKEDFNQLVEYFSTQQFYYPKDSVFSYQAAAQIFFECQRKGITIRSTIDCLIAQIAIEHELVLLHNDKDFERIAKINSKLKLLG